MLTESWKKNKVHALFLISKHSELYWVSPSLFLAKSLGIFLGGRKSWIFCITAKIWAGFFFQIVRRYAIDLKHAFLPMLTVTSVGNMCIDFWKISRFFFKPFLIISSGEIVFLQNMLLTWLRNIAVFCLKYYLIEAIIDMRDLLSAQPEKKIPAMCGIHF